MHRQSVPQGRGRRARDRERDIDAADRRVQTRRDDPIAAARLAAFREIAGQVQGTALAGAGMLDRPILCVHPAHPHLDAARADQQAVAGRDLAGGNRPGHDQPNARQ